MIVHCFFFFHFLTYRHYFFQFLFVCLHSLFLYFFLFSFVTPTQYHEFSYYIHVKNSQIYVWSNHSPNTNLYFNLTRFSKSVFSTDKQKTAQWSHHIIPLYTLKSHLSCLNLFLAKLSSFNSFNLFMQSLFSIPLKFFIILFCNLSYLYIFFAI